MHYYLCRHRDWTPVRNEPRRNWRPPTNQGFGSLDFSPPRGLTPNPDSIGDGLVLLAVRQRDGDVERAPGSVYLGDDLDDLVGGDLCARHMGVNFKGGGPVKGAGTLRDVICDLFFEHATPDNDKSKWNRLGVVPALSAHERARYEVWLANECILEVPVVSGGATYTESFNTANSTTLGPDLTWTEVIGNVGVTSNQAENYGTTSGIKRARAASDTATSNMYAKFLTADPSAGSIFPYDVGPIVRYASGADTGYVGYPTTDGYATYNNVNKVVAGSVTNLASITTPDPVGLPTAIGDEVYVSAVGSTVKLKIMGTVYATVTDTSITTGTRAGFTMPSNTTAGRTALDSFEYGDLAAPSIVAQRARRTNALMV